MIESLVEQIEARFADAQAQMSDPEVISDRERFAEAGRAFNRLAPAAKLAEEWRLAQSNFEGARELIGEGGEGADPRAEMDDARERIERPEGGNRPPVGGGGPHHDKKRIREDPGG